MKAKAPAKKVKTARSFNQFFNRKNSLLIAALVAVSIFIGYGIYVITTRAATTSFHFSAVSDSFIDSTAPDTNFGTNTSLRTDGDPVVKSYVKFNVTGVAGTITKATVRLNAATNNAKGFSAYKVSDNSWSETGITYNNAPSHGSSLGTSNSVVAGTYQSVNVTSAISGNGTYSFAIAMPTSTTNTRFNSRETTFKPQLYVEWEVQTEPSTSDPILMTAGDIACKPGDIRSEKYCHHSDTANLLGPADYVLPLGDLQYESASGSEFSVYDSTWGKYKSKTYPVVGNHEYLTSGAAGYYTYWAGKGSPMEPTCKSNCKGYYSFDIGSNWHVVVLNTNCSKVGGCGAGSSQHNWLKADLAAKSKPCIAAAFHHPLYASGADYYPGVTAGKPLWDVLMQYNADVVLAGHNHVYERFDIMDSNGNIDRTNGIRSFLVGSGGKNLRSFVATPVTGSQIRNNTVYGVLRLTLHPNSYDWKFVPEAGKTWTDTGTQSCGN
jgi:hypothetical protein